MFYASQVISQCFLIGKFCGSKTVFPIDIATNFSSFSHDNFLQLIYNFFHKIWNEKQTSNNYQTTQILENPVNGIQAALASFHSCIILFYKNVHGVPLFYGKRPRKPLILLHKKIFNFFQILFRNVVNDPAMPVFIRFAVSFSSADQISGQWHFIQSTIF